MKKLLFIFALMNLLSFSAIASPTLNLDFSLDRTSFSTEDAAGNENDGDNFDKYYSISLLFGVGIEYGVFYHLEDFDSGGKQSLLGAMASFGDRFFLDLGVGQYKTDLTFDGSETGLGFLFRPGMQFQTGSSSFVRVSIPYLYGSAENDVDFKISRSSFRPYIGFGIKF